MTDFRGKTVLVTGASRGIGAAIARTAAKAGARIVVHYARDARGAEATAAACGGGALALQADLSVEHAGAALWRAAEQAAGPVDSLVNNAGVYAPTPLGGGDSAWAEGWRANLQVNLVACADLCRAAIAAFEARGGGRIVNIASRAGHRGDGLDFAGYAASKAGVLALTKTYARALSGAGVRLYAVAPGWVETEMSPTGDARARALAEIPLGRMAQADEIAALVAFLLSDACTSATGATFDVNGASYVR